MLDGLAYETLLTIDCAHHVRPQLARDVDRNPDGSVTVHLRTDAAFWSGDPISARAVIASWRIATDPVARLIADSARVLDDHTLRLLLPDDDVTILADPALAVRRSIAGARWPEGTGPYRVRPAFPTVPSRVFHFTPVRDSTQPTVVVRIAGDGDDRDLVDAGFDVLLTEDSTLAAYASRTGDRTTPLRWAQIIALVIPVSTGVHAAVVPDSLRARLTGELRASLARNVVRAEARPADPAGPPPGCFDESLTASHPASEAKPDMPRTAATRAGAVPRLVYPERDAVARAIAERLVALATMGIGGGDAARGLALVAPSLAMAGRSIRAVGLDDSSLASALVRGDEAGYVIRRNARVTEPCADLMRLLAVAPWLRDAEASLDRSFVPLVELRERIVLRGDRAGIRLDGLGLAHPVWRGGPGR